MKTLWTIIATAAIALPSFAQTSSPRLELEVDPIAYALNGYSFHAIVVKNRVRTDLGVFGIEQPEGYSGNNGYHIKSKGVGMKVNYLVDAKQHWFAGIGFGYANNQVRLNETGETVQQGVASVGVHAGYRWFMFPQKSNALRNLYVTPWMSIDYNTTTNRIKFEDSGYKQKSFTLFPTVHIGYRFSK